MTNRELLEQINQRLSVFIVSTKDNFRRVFEDPGADIENIDRRIDFVMKEFVSVKIQCESGTIFTGL
jgi:hypothetical protein